MFEKLVVWVIKKLIKEKFAVKILKKLIAWTLPEYHLSKNPVRKQKVKEEEVTNNV